MLLSLNISGIGDRVLMFWQILITDEIFIKSSQMKRKMRTF